MQNLNFLQNIGWIILFLGILLICVATLSAIKESTSRNHGEQTQSKGVILLGPIPIVWGYGRRGWMIAGAAGIVILLIWIISFL